MGLKSKNGIGAGQSWQDVTAGRTSGSTYTNNTGRPILVVIRMNFGGVTGVMSLSVDGVIICDMGSTSAAGSTMTASAIVPNGKNYVINISGGIAKAVFELR